MLYIIYTAFIAVLFYNKNEKYIKFYNIKILYIILFLFLIIIFEINFLTVAFCSDSSSSFISMTDEEHSIWLNNANILCENFIEQVEANSTKKGIFVNSTKASLHSNTFDINTFLTKLSEIITKETTLKQAFISFTNPEVLMPSSDVRFCMERFMVNIETTKLFIDGVDPFVELRRDDISLDDYNKFKELKRLTDLNMSVLDSFETDYSWSDTETNDI